MLSIFYTPDSTLTLPCTWQSYSQLWLENLFFHKQNFFPKDSVSYYLLKTFHNSLVRPSSRKGTVCTQCLWPNLHQGRGFLLLSSISMFLVFLALKKSLKCLFVLWLAALCFPHGGLLVVGYAGSEQSAQRHCPFSIKPTLPTSKILAAPWYPVSGVLDSWYHRMFICWSKHHPTGPESRSPQNR